MSIEQQISSDYTFQKINSFYSTLQTARVENYTQCSMFETKLMFYLRTFLKIKNPNIFPWQIEISQFNN